MNRTTHPFTRLAALVTTVATLVLVTAGQASAMRPPDPAPGDPGRGYDGPSRTSVQLVTDSSISVLQWVLFVAAVTAALLVGAGLMHLAHRQRAQVAH
jgi:hypothetical protein